MFSSVLTELELKFSDVQVDNMSSVLNSIGNSIRSLDTAVNVISIREDVIDRQVRPYREESLLELCSIIEDQKQYGITIEMVLERWEYALHELREIERIAIDVRSSPIETKNSRPSSSGLLVKNWTPWDTI